MYDDNSVNYSYPPHWKYVYGNPYKKSNSGSSNGDNLESGSTNSLISVTSSKHSRIQKCCIFWMILAIILAISLTAFAIFTAMTVFGNETEDLSSNDVTSAPSLLSTNHESTSNDYKTGDLITNDDPTSSNRHTLRTTVLATAGVTTDSPNSKSTMKDDPSTLKEIATTETTVAHVEQTTSQPGQDDLTTSHPTTDGPTSIDQTTSDPTTDLPTTVEPTTINPTTFKLTTDEPTAAEPTTIEDTTIQPTTIVPTTFEPTSDEPTTIEPSTAEPTTAATATTQPTTIEPTTFEPTTVEPTTPEPTTVELTTIEPTTTGIPTTEYTTEPDTTTAEETTMAITTIAPTTEIETTTLEPIGLWLGWSSWSQCDATCGLAFQTRTRVCYEEPCKGTAEQVQMCEVVSCEEYGTWENWGPWYPSCSDLICDEDARQYRDRFCQLESGQTTCPGPDFQQRSCYQGECQNCTVCPVGMDTDPACTKCVCNGNTMHGRVESNGRPIKGALIADTEIFHILLATSDDSGNYVLEDVCEGRNYTFTSSTPGYIAEEVTGVNGERNVEMEKFTPLVVTMHPESKGRRPGEDVTLCCDAESNIGYDYIEWLHNGLLVDPTRIEYEPELVMSAVDVADFGLYHCRVNNDATSTVSDPALFNVQATEPDYCPQLPESLIEPLPPGCLLHGLPEVDVGVCSNIPCRNSTNTDTANCSDGNDVSCCGVIVVETLRIPCDDGTVYDVDLVTQCGCTTC